MAGSELRGKDGRMTVLEKAHCIILLLATSPEITYAPRRLEAREERCKILG